MVNRSSLGVKALKLRFNAVTMKSRMLDFLIGKAIGMYIFKRSITYIFKMSIYPYNIHTSLIFLHTPTKISINEGLLMIKLTTATLFKINEHICHVFCCSSVTYKQQFW